MILCMQDTYCYYNLNVALYNKDCLQILALMQNFVPDFLPHFFSLMSLF